MIPKSALGGFPSELARTHRHMGGEVANTHETVHSTNNILYIHRHNSSFVHSGLLSLSSRDSSRVVGVEGQCQADASRRHNSSPPLQSGHVQSHASTRNRLVSALEMGPSIAVDWLERLETVALPRYCPFPCGSSDRCIELHIVLLNSLLASLPAAQGAVSTFWRLQLPRHVPDTARTKLLLIRHDRMSAVPVV